jgi:RimJ/RimL family protein N-acetyltransferase
MRPSPSAAKGLRHRLLRLEDHATLVRWFSDSEIQGTIEDEELSPAEIEEKARRLIAYDPRTDRQVGYMLEFGARPVGLIHYMWINWISRNAEVDFFLEPGCRGKPFLGALAARKIPEVGFRVLKLHKLYGFNHGSNQRSLALFGQMMKVEARLRRYLVREGRFEDVLVLGALASEYEDKGSRCGRLAGGGRT